MVLARALTFGGAVALATASVAPWFSADVTCGWTCYSPLPRDGVEWALLVHDGPSTAFGALGPWIGAVLVLVVLVALLALVLDARGRRPPRALALGATAGAVAILVRVVTQPDLTSRHTSNRFVAIEPSAYVGSAGALVAALGVALLALRRREGLASSA